MVNDVNVMDGLNLEIVQLTVNIDNSKVVEHAQKRKVNDKVKVNSSFSLLINDIQLKLQLID